MLKWRSLLNRSTSNVCKRTTELRLRRGGRLSLRPKRAAFQAAQAAAPDALLSANLRSFTQPSGPVLLRRSGPLLLRP
jgi:hypothetical protein